MANFAGTCTSDNKGLLLLLLNINIFMKNVHKNGNKFK